jgi:hypothetical protein
MLAWLLPLIPFLYLYKYHGVFASYMTVPVWLSCGLLYVVFGRLLLKQPAPAI